MRASDVPHGNPTSDETKGQKSGDLGRKLPAARNLRRQVPSEPRLMSDFLVTSGDEHLCFQHPMKTIRAVPRRLAR